MAESSKLQSQSSVWWEHRKGCLTTSKFSAICRTKIEKPSESLISDILSSKKSPKVPALSWGIDNENTAREAYKEITSLDHEDFVVTCTGLHVCVSSAHLGASPDGLTSCSCCGKGIVEIKCPYSV